MCLAGVLSADRRLLRPPEELEAAVTSSSLSTVKLVTLVVPPEVTLCNITLVKSVANDSC